MERHEPLPGAVAPDVGREAEVVVPGDRATPDLARLADAPRLEDVPALVAGRRVGGRGLDPPVIVGRGHDPRLMGPDRPARRGRRRAVAEAAIDRVLGGEEDRDRLTAIAGRGVLGGHQPAEDPAPAMGRSDRHARHRRRRKLGAARDGEPAGKAPERPDDPVAFECGPHAAQVPVPAGRRSRSPPRRGDRGSPCSPRRRRRSARRPGWGAPGSASARTIAEAREPSSVARRGGRRDGTPSRRSTAARSTSRWPRRPTRSGSGSPTG